MLRKISIITILIFIHMLNINPKEVINLKSDSSKMITPLYIAVDDYDTYNYNLEPTLAMFIKQVIKYYGKDKLYNMVCEYEKNGTKLRLGFCSKNGRFNRVATFSTTDAALHKSKEIFEDSLLIEHFVDLLYNVPHITAYNPNNNDQEEPFLRPDYYSILVIEFPALVRTAKSKHESLSKDEFMNWYEAQLDSILNIPLEYKFDWNDTTKNIPKRRVPQNITEYEQMRHSK